MSLLASVNSGATSLPYAIQNVGRTADTPCIKAGFLSAIPGVSDSVVRVGNPVNGMILTGGGGSVIPLVRGINGGSATTAGGEQLLIGASSASFQNIVLTDGVTAINGDLVMSAATSDLTVGGDILVGGGIGFLNGASGESISNYYQQNSGPYNCPDGADTVVANPAGLTAGWHIVAAITAAGGQAQEQVASIAYWSGAGWVAGGCCSSIAGTGRFALNVSTSRTTLVLSNSTGVAQNGVTVNFAKLLN